MNRTDALTGSAELEPVIEFRGAFRDTRRFTQSEGHSTMRRLFGSLLILHGVAHAGAGMWVIGVRPHWAVSALWLVSGAGFLTAGAGLLGARWLDRHWRPLSVIAALASLGLLAMFPHPALMIGAAIDGALLVTAIPFAREIVVRSIGVPAHPPQRHLSALGTTLALALTAYFATLVVLRPWHMRWGVSDAELASTLPGDERVTHPRYRIDHGVTINAPVDAVWPWLAQIGQDRAGFYSYDWLERLVGDPVHNVDRVVPEWQSIHRGDFVRAAPPDYLGGAFGARLGWPVTDVLPGRAIVLDGWGSFALIAVNDTTTRILVRTLGDRTPSLIGVPLASLGTLVLEPAHFLMQRRMLLGIKERAEGAWTNR